MHVAVDLNWLLQFVVFALAAVFGFLYLVRNTASRFFVVDSNFGSTGADFSPEGKNRESMAAAVGGAAEVSDSCAVCGLVTKKQCARCKMVKYCSEACQRSHWNSEHKTKCKDLQSFYETNHTKSTYALRERKAALVPAGGSSKILKQSNKILFPYEEFVQFFNWEKPGYPPCGLLNCGNSCFANVVLQCLAYTRPLVAYLLEKGHKIECRMDKWCFLCELQTHVERASQSCAPFSPINILSRLPNIGGNLGYGKQEDAHEFMRFAIDTMQSVCLDEFGGEKAVHPSYQETTLVQHIFGGRLQSQVMCTKCNKVSNQFENMMDLTVEIHGDAESLEECLDQFTAKEWLHGDNMYKCDGCSAYVIAWKRLAVQRAPNILTIALKRFQSGRFGKLNKRVTFPETLNLRSYMSDLEDGNDVYKLYAVIVHVDMLNASFFGHYICYVKDFHGNWYRIDDCKVSSVDLDEVLSQGAYMLLYSRICARPSCLLPAVLLKKQENENVKIPTVDPSLTQPTECLSSALCHSNPVNSGNLSSAECSEVELNCEEELSSIKNAEDERGDVEMVSCDASLSIVNIEPHDTDGLSISSKEVASPMQPDVHNFEQASPISDFENVSQGNKRDTNEGLSRMLAEESSAAGNCTFEKDRTYDITSITTGEVRGENSANPTSMPENAKCEGNGSVSPADDTRDVAKKSNGESSGMKLKPIFAPGFLGKQPRKEFIKQKNEVSVELGERTSKLYLNNQKNEVVKPCFLSENGSFLKGEEKPHFVLENGKVSMESAGRKSLENGDSGHQTASSERIKTNMNKERRLQQNLVDNKSHGELVVESSLSRENK